MLNKKLALVALFAGLTSASFAQIKLNDKASSALSDGMTALTFSDADARALAKQGVAKLDSANTVAAANDPYTLRLNSLISKLPKVEGVTMNYKVYKTKDINAFACADGSVRVFSGLMDMMTDDELIGVVGHEIGHVVNHDTRDAIKAAYTRSAAQNAVGSTSTTVATLTDSQIGALANALLEAKHSRKQESEADDFSYNFMKKNKYNVMGLASAFEKLASMETGADNSKLTKMMSSHPDSKDRAAAVIAKAKQDGLYKEKTQTATTTTPATTTTAKSTTATKTTTTKTTTTSKPKSTTAKPKK
ncbi:M48 family metalloprotease [Pinibacter soli]|uniref:M48 family metalloprotease n=1 Tax=Pinibacter soli TaxID=3044211 RepID=A0ABT6RGY8_9BACT|nr:M48 family metalloprotease [Pinibacter soli]MDI3321830.1 M48 family metalloprotease [Pinibacter soli]